MDIKETVSDIQGTFSPQLQIALMDLSGTLLTALKDISFEDSANLVNENIQIISNTTQVSFDNLTGHYPRVGIFKNGELVAFDGMEGPEHFNNETLTYNIGDLIITLN